MKTKLSLKGFVLALGLMATTLWVTSPGAHAQALDYQNYNAIIFNDLYTTSDIEGRTFVGHDFTGANSANLGNHLGNFIPPVPADDRTFVVGNNIFAGNQVNLQRGSTYIDGDIEGSRSVHSNGGGTVYVDHTIDASTASIFNYSIAESQALSSLAADSTVAFPTVQDGPTKFFANAGADGLAVFNMSADNIFNNTHNQQFELIPDALTSNVVINVSGLVVDWEKGNMVGLFNDNYWQGHTLWNFYEATTIDFDHNFNGAILAPYASITTSTNIDGLVVANNLHTTAEVHLPNDGNAYDGYTAAVPEPGSVTFILALGGVMLVVRNRRLLV